MVDKETTEDKVFVKKAINTTQAITDTTVQKVYADGAYHSNDNETF